MFNYRLFVSKLGNAYLALVGMAQLFAGTLACVAIIEADRLEERGTGLLNACYEVLSLFDTTAGASAFALALVLGGLGCVIVAVIRLRDNAWQARQPRVVMDPLPPLV